MHAFTLLLRHSLLRQRLHPSTLLAWMMFLVPALGVPSELMLQDTLKSALVAFGTLGAAMVFFWQQRDRTEPLLWHGLVWLPLALMAYALGSMVWSHTYLAGVEAIRWFLLALLLWLGLNTLTRDNIPTLLRGIHLGVVVASVWTALQFWFDLRWFPQGAPPSSTFVNRNFFAEYAVSVLPLSVWLLATMRPSRMLLWMATSLALNVTAILMTGTRSALVALLVLLPLLGFILIKYRAQLTINQWTHAHRWSVGLLLVLGVAGLGVIPTDHPDIAAGTTPLGVGFTRTASMTKSSEYRVGSFSIRSQMWMATARMMIEHPWTGVGAGAWEVQIPLYQRLSESVETDYYAHNEYLQLLSEYGLIVGGLVLAILFAYLLVSAGKTWRLRGESLTEAPLRAFTLTSLLALLIVSNAGFPLRLASTGALLAISLAILARTDTQLRFQESFFAAGMHWQAKFSQVMLAALICGSFLALYITYQAGDAERKIVGAIQMGNAATALNQSDGDQSPERKKQLLKNIREGIAINPHYRKLSPEVADQLATHGDFANAIWIWESVAASRPNIAAIWSNLTRGYASLGQNDKALHALHEWQRLQPGAADSKALEVLLLSRMGHVKQATDLITSAYDENHFDLSLLQTGYVLGMQTRNWLLAIRSLELQAKAWPEQAADAHFKLGMIYAGRNMHDEAKALAEFRAGAATVQLEQRDRYKSQLPEPYRSKI